MQKICLLLILLCTISAEDIRQQIEALSDEIEAKVIEWRRYFHQYPELSNREFKTAAKIEGILRKLDVEIKTKVAHTGVVALLKGGKPGPVVALRADMDGLPIVERVDLPFASKEKTIYNGKKVGVMHACGHDTHVAILLGVAEVLTKIKKDLKGSVKFIFQPAEEGAPEGEEGGAELMVKEGVLQDPPVDVIFGLHINSGLEVGTIGYRPGGTMASYDGLFISVKGKQTHGAYPWAGVDPIVTSAQIIIGLQTTISRNAKLIDGAAVVTIGSIHGGNRGNIIPEIVEMVGTIRTLDPRMQDQVHENIRRVVTNIAASAGAVADVRIKRGYPVTYNDPKLTIQMAPTFKRVAGVDHVLIRNAVTGAEDFSFFQQKVPGLFFFLGGRPKNIKPIQAPPHHSPDFHIDESGMKLGVKTMCNLVVDYMDQQAR
ncbi:amidohydrolase [Candidatus Uabimicrobium amorphum]|uniref:N-acyl-L-amino acid amidohydrolase n=1 Tax=Uabimicrobium amorphum TaxID=2596890 RepID=A0A5S9ISR1_UABAM|nr:amidohydrolase [Candidatus Uabimicrobium amorphum]BBM87468.1 N-acyl-L-amino acid amidohydrolase [Candidatus Uabimicrobium amorphum]